jgi:hypothetical protein
VWSCGFSRVAPGRAVATGAVVVMAVSPVFARLGFDEIHAATFAWIPVNSL